jgi:hypothetical protein
MLGKIAVRPKAIELKPRGERLSLVERLAGQGLSPADRFRVMRPTQEPSAHAYESKDQHDGKETAAYPLDPSQI